MTSDFLKKFLAPADIERGLVEVSELAREEGVEVALCGGVAMQLFGSDRMTKDIDFVVSDLIKGVERIKSLSFGGNEVQGIKGLTPTDVPVDLILRTDDYADLYDTALEKAELNRELGIKVVAPEYLAVMKLAAGRVKDEEDLNTLIRLKTADMTAAKKISRRFLGSFAERDLQSHIDEMEWRMAKEDKENT